MLRPRIASSTSAVKIAALTSAITGLLSTSHTPLGPRM
jgi:hypothetical protein